MSPATPSAVRWRRHSPPHSRRISLRPSCRATSALHGGNDSRVGSAATDVAAHRLANVVVALAPWLVQHRGGGHDLPGGAVPTLETIVLDECPLHRMQRGGVAGSTGEPFDGGDLVALRHHGKGEAGEHATTLDV